jgi:hypothetical protein
MGDIVSSIESNLLDYIRQDDYLKMKNIIEKNNINKDIMINPHKRTLIQHCTYFGSINCLKELIYLNFDINKLEYNTNNSPLFIACKFNYIELVYLLLNNDKQECITLRKNNEGLNEFEVAFLRGNYEVCFYLLYLYNEKNNDFNQENNEIDKKNIEEIQLKINSLEILKTKEKNKYLEFFNNEDFILEKYLGYQEYLSYPIFNLQLFYESLKQKIDPEKCPDFSTEKKKTKELLNKVPDPNESWKNFMKRILKMELYNPPLVDKNSVNKYNSLYMKTQMKMISMEYGINMDFKKDNDIKNQENKLKLNNKKIEENENDNIDNEDEKRTSEL